MLKTCWVSLVFRIWMAIVVAFFTAAALADRTSALTITTAPVTFPAVVLDGTDQMLSSNSNLWRADAVGENSGWNVTVASSDFVNEDGKIISVANLEIRLQDENIIVVSGDENCPVSMQTSFFPASGTASKICSAADGEGNGVYDLLPEAQLKIPAETYSGAYSSTLTISINTGP